MKLVSHLSNYPGAQESRLHQYMRDLAPRVLLLALYLFATLVPASALNRDDGQRDHNIEIASFITWWSHDAVGYHPAIAFTIENVSGRDLTGTVVHFQARFTDLRNGYVTVARKEVLEDKFPPNGPKTMLLRGSSAFELPIDQASWPQMECKVMCRVGDVDDTGTETLLLARLESTVMTDEEAQDSLNNRADIRPPKTERHHHRADHGDPGPAPSAPKPLAAAQLSLNSPLTVTKPQHVDTKKGLDKFLAQNSIAGLGDNFLQFETTYKQQGSDIDQGHAPWTWIRYTQESPHFTIYDGAKTSSGNSDVLVVRLRADEVQSEVQLSQLIKTMAGKLKAQPLEHVKKTVTYAHGLRVEMSSVDAAGYHALWISPSKENPDYIVIISRLPGNPRTVLPDTFRKTQMLKFMTPLFGDPEPE